MNDVPNHSQSSSPNKEGARSQLNLDATTWPAVPPEKVIPIGPITPLSFAFMSEEERTAFKFPGKNDVKNNLDDVEEKKPAEEDWNNSVNVLSTFHSSVSLQHDSGGSSSSSRSTSESSPPFSQKSFTVNELLMVDGDHEPRSPSEPYQPKAHLGWASFGESIKPSPPTTKAPVAAPLRRKVYVIRSHNRDKSKPYHIVKRRPAQETSEPAVPSKVKTPIVVTDLVSSDSDEDVDVVGIDDDEIAPPVTPIAPTPTEAVKTPVDTVQAPPDLPPQPSFGSRLGVKVKRDHRSVYDSDEDDSKISRYEGNFSPPPQLEPQTSEATVVMKRTSRSFELNPAVEENSIEKRLKIDEVDSSQMLKTKISSSTIPILPLSKSIMERKKVAIEMTRNAVIKKINPPKPTFKNFTVAPKNVQIPAYQDNAPVTLYSNINKPSNSHKDARGRCLRCRDRSPVDMSTFKFVEDSTVVAVRAHLCDQTRVMIARTAIWNREYAKRLGDRANGTVWQKPDEVTAQMTGFCSATIRRCIDIANLSIVPRCADRIGVSKNELASLKTSFGNEKFFGQTMRTPHVLTQYYAVKAQNATDRASSSTNGPPQLPRMGRPPGSQEKDEVKDEEEERRHHPLTYYQPSDFSKMSSLRDDRPESTATTSEPQKTFLRWNSIQTPRILRPPGVKFTLPKMAVVPVMKKKTLEPKEEEPAAPSVPRRRGRPRKLRPVVTVQSSTRRLRSHRKDEKIWDKDVQNTVEFLVEKVCRLYPNETS